MYKYNGASSTRQRISKEHIILSGHRPNAFCLRNKQQKTRQGYPLLPLLFSIVLKMLASQYGKKKIVKNISLDLKCLPKAQVLKAWSPA
jgi:hypothetical protein